MRQLKCHRQLGFTAPVLKIGIDWDHSPPVCPYPQADAGCNDINRNPGSSTGANVAEQQDTRKGKTNQAVMPQRFLINSCCSETEKAWLHPVIEHVCLSYGVPLLPQSLRAQTSLGLAMHRLAMKTCCSLWSAAQMTRQVLVIKLARMQLAMAFMQPPLLLLQTSGTSSMTGGLTACRISLKRAQVLFRQPEAQDGLVLAALIQPSSRKQSSSAVAL